MNRSEMMQRLHEKTGIEPARCIRVIDALFGDGDEDCGMIADALYDSEEPVIVPRFGTFHKIRVGERSGVSPNGTPWKQPAHWRPAFRPAASLKARVHA